MQRAVDKQIDALLVAGMALVTIGLLVLDSFAWFVRYGVVACGLTLSTVSVYKTVGDTTTHETH